MCVCWGTSLVRVLRDQLIESIKRVCIVVLDTQGYITVWRKVTKKVYFVMYVSR